jgi:acid-sensing ion channel 5
MEADRDLIKNKMLARGKSLAEALSTNGIPNIFRSEYNIVKIMWIILTTISFGYCCYGLVRSTIEYFQYDTVTQMSMDRRPYLTFPTVTICPQSPYRTNSLNFPLKLKSVFQFIENIVYNISGGTDSVFSMLMAQNLIDVNVKLSKLTEAENLLTYNSIDDMLLNCLFNLDFCNASDFKVVYTTKYGNCFLFNSGFNSENNKIPILSSSNPGKQNSLRIDLLIDKAVTGISFVKSNGVVIFIHNASTIPLYQNEGIELSPGFETNVALFRSEFKQCGPPYSGCVSDVNSVKAFDSNLYRATIVDSGSAYRQKYCLQLCLQRYLLNQCECKLNLINLKINSCVVI